MRFLRSALVVIALPIVAPEAAPQNARAQMLVDVAWLQKHLRDQHLVLLHVGDRAEYEREHIPGARFVRQQDPLRLEQGVVERTDAGQKRRQDDDSDAETGDRPMGPGHQLPVL